MPTPTRGESESAFVSRYVGSKEAVKSHPDSKQRVVIAYSVYREAKKKRPVSVLADSQKS